VFVRLKRSVQDGKAYEYLQLVRSFRVDGKPRQEVLLSLGRREELVASGQLDDLVVSLARFSERLRVVEKVRTQDLSAASHRLWGPPLVFERLWRNQGLHEVLSELAEGRKFQFDVERVCFALALQRLCQPGSDLQGSAWAQTVEAPGLACLELQHMYRTCRFLGEVREKLERDLFLRDRTLFDQELDLLFVDTTSTYVYRDSETSLRRWGYSRDHRPDLPQFVLAVAVDAHGWPIAWEVLPGNTADTAALHHMLELFRKRFRIRRAIVVADRGMIGKETIAALTGDRQAPFDFILGCRMRQQKEVTEEVLSRAGRYHRVRDNLEIKEVRVGDRRYVVCRNEEEARKDAAAREAILAKLKQTLESSGPKAIVGNRGFRRFLKVERGGVTVDAAAIRRDERFDGKFVLRTNTELPTEEVALTYKGLWRVERTFRETKSTLEVRPVFHKLDVTSVGHIVGCFLALRLEVDLQRRLDEKKLTVSWPTLMHDLGEVRAITVDLDGERYLLRTDMAGSAFMAFQAAGVRVPARLTHLGPAPPREEGDDVSETPGEDEGVVPSLPGALAKLAATGT
jgi:hypothetical protein